MFIVILLQFNQVFMSVLNFFKFLIKFMVVLLNAVSWGSYR